MRRLEKDSTTSRRKVRSFKTVDDFHSKLHGLTLLPFSAKKKTENNENKQNILLPTMQQEMSPVNLLPNNMQQANNNQQNIASLTNLNQTLSWTCELCGRMFGNRDEWTMHAKSHLEVNFLSIFFFNGIFAQIRFAFISVLTKRKKFNRRNDETIN